VHSAFAGRPRTVHNKPFYLLNTIQCYTTLVKKTPIVSDVITSTPSEIFCVYLGVFTSDSGTYGPAAFDANDLTGDVGCRRHAEE
jgi:hypothetical protein